MGGLSIAVILLLNSSQAEAHKIQSERSTQKNANKVKDSELVEMGSKLSNLSLSMLTKEESDEYEISAQAPSNAEMV